MHCDAPVVPGRVRCAQHLAAVRSERNKEAYYRRKANGRCPYCNRPKVDGRAVCEKCLERLRIASRIRRQKPIHREAKREWRLGYKYGLSVAEVAELLAAQDGRCAICRRAEEEAGRFHVDHDHRFGRGNKRSVRGLLCPDCNTAIGKLGDDRAGVQRAVDYLAKFEGETPWQR